MAHARLATVLVLGALGLGACARTSPSSLSMHEALAAAEAGGAQRPPAVPAVRSGFGYQAPHTPLVVPPDVRRIWVTTHVTEEGTLVQGHWVFVPVKTWQWFVEQPVTANGLGVAVPPDATSPPWPAPIESRRRTVVPWTVDPKAPATPGHVEPPPEPQAPDGGPRPGAANGPPTRLTPR
jgi:type IV conjugative transfer system lipoprotein TraV